MIYFFSLPIQCVQSALRGIVKDKAIIEWDQDLKVFDFRFRREHLNDYCCQTKVFHITFINNACILTDL